MLRKSGRRTRESSSTHLSDRAARAHLSMLLRMRARADAGDPPGRHEAFVAAMACSELVREVMGWAAGALGLTYSSSAYARVSVKEVRALIIATIALGLPILQEEAREALLEALVALNAGRALPLVHGTLDRRRTAPHRSAEAELGLLMWIRWQHGLGRKVSDAKIDVARETGCSLNAVEKWRAPLEKVFGKWRVEWQLRIAEEIGRFEAAGKDITDVWPWSSEQGHMFWISLLTLERHLAPLVEKRRAAIRKRSIANARHK